MRSRKRGGKGEEESGWMIGVGISEVGGIHYRERRNKWWIDPLGPIDGDEDDDDSEADEGDDDFSTVTLKYSFSLFLSTTHWGFRLPIQHGGKTTLIFNGCRMFFYKIIFTKTSFERNTS